MPDESHSSNIMPKGLRIPVAIGTLVYLLLAVYWAASDFTIMRSDLLEYVRWSRLLWEPDQWNWLRASFHVPGYPVIIAIGDAITFGLLSDVLLVQFLEYAFWMMGVVYAWRLLDQFCPSAKSLGVLIFSLYPFVGVTLAAMGRADVPATAVFLAALFYGINRKPWKFMLFGGLALITHKSMWPYMFFATWICLWKYRLQWWTFFLSGVPLVGYWVVVAVNRPDFLLKVIGVDASFVMHTEWKTETVRTLPLFDGIFGTLFAGSAKEAAQGSILLGIFLVAVLLAIYFLRKRTRDWMQIALIIPTLLLCVMVHQSWAWPILRFSKPLVIPFCVWLVAHPRLLEKFNHGLTYAAVAVILVATQFAWGVYVIIYFLH